MVPLEEIFCFVDDFCKHFDNYLNLLPHPNRKRKRMCSLSLSEIMTIMILFQFSHYRTFKDFYKFLCVHHKKDFPSLVSYNRFIELMPLATMPLLVLLLKMPGTKTDRYFIDSTKLPVCHNLRIRQHKVFEGLAELGKTSTGWFFGFKLHLIINHLGEIMSFRLTSGNKDDRSLIEKMSLGLKGWMFGDRGYISSKLAKKLKNKHLELITSLKKNMKKRFISPIQKWWLRKRGVIESVIQELKARLHLQHTRHRSPSNFLVNILSTLVAYVLKPKKPHVSFTNHIANQALIMSN